MMSKKLKSLISIFLAAIWISISEFTRNEFLLKSYWVSHYTGMGLVFPDEPMNGAMWGVWALVFSVLIYIIAVKFTLAETTFLSWCFGFVLMWLVIGNLGVLPFVILYAAVPISLLEAFIASLIIFKVNPK